MAMNNSLKIPKFYGTNNVEFAEYSAKLLAVGAIQGSFNNALEGNLKIALTAVDRADNVKKQTIAWGYLVLTLAGSTAAVLNQVTIKNPFMAWELLKTKCAATSTDAYTQVAQQFKIC